MSFKSIWKAFRRLETPNQAPPIYSGGNTDAATDNNGVLWTRDANAPPGPASLSPSEWARFYNSSFGQVPISGTQCLVYVGNCFAGVIGTTWDTAPVYFQLFLENGGALPIAGEVPTFSIPVPAIPGAASLNFDPVPFLGDGIAWAISSTPDVYTAVALAVSDTATVQIAWSNYP